MARKNDTSPPITTGRGDRRAASVSKAPTTTGVINPPYA